MAKLQITNTQCNHNIMYGVWVSPQSQYHVLLSSPTVQQARADGQFHGFGFTTDESPPSATRFMGLRFQITNMYWLTFADPDTWSASRYSDAYPCQRERHLTDIVNCPGKTGLATLEVLEKQFSTKGCSRFDAQNGVGDGGGENEGMVDGIHKSIEDSNPTYVRRR